MTEDDLITTETSTPSASSRSSIALAVTTELITLPPPISTSTRALIGPVLMSTTLPLMTLRALSFMRLSRPKTKRTAPQPVQVSFRGLALLRSVHAEPYGGS